MPKCQASGTNPRECDQDFTRLTHLHRWLHCSVCLLHCIWGCSPCQDNNSAKKTETHSSDRCQISQQNRLLSDNFYYRDYNAILEHTRCHVCPSDENHKEKRKKERKKEKKCKAFPLQAFYRHWGFQAVQAPRFHDNRHMNVVRLSVLCTGCLCLPRNIPGTHFC